MIRREWRLSEPRWRMERAPGLALLAMVSCLLAAACATSPAVSPRRVDGVPDGRYRVTVSANPASMSGYDAVLFETTTPGLTLEAPNAEPRGLATPRDFAPVLWARSVTYELRSAAGTVLGYLVVAPQAQVQVWDQGAGGGGLVVSVTGAAAAPEAGGGGGGAGGM